MKKKKILALGDFNFTKNLYAYSNSDIEAIYTIMSCHMTRPIKEKLKKLALKKKITIKFLEHKRLKKFGFFNKIDWNDIPPLSQEIVTKMKYAESETMKMYERIHHIKPSLYETRYKHYYQSLRLFNYLLDNWGVDVCIRYSVPHMGYDNVLYHLCKIKGIPTYCVYFLYPHWGYFVNDLHNPLKNFNMGKSTEVWKFPRLEQTFLQYWNNTKLSYNPTVVPVAGRAAKIQTKRKVSFNQIDKFYKSKQLKHVDISEPYIYVPLHFQYEATSCPLGEMFVDQHFMLEILAQTGYRIYVKEHPRISANRSLNYYSRILKLKNTYLIPKNYDNFTLINNALATATITGTAAWESLLKGKFTLLFGHIFYKYAPNVFETRSLEEVNEAIEIIKTVKSVEKKDIIEFLHGVEKHLFFLTHEEISKNFYEEISKNFYRRSKDD